MSVAICTVRADEDLVRAVTAVVAQLQDGDEVLVVHSGRAEPALPAALASLGAVRAVAEPRRSSSAARTTALAAARHDVVLFLDDDCEPEPGWVAALRRAMTPPEVAAAGGTIWPRWPGARPRWLHPKLATSYGERDAATTTHQPFAANLGVRARLVVDVGGLHPDLGHHDGTPGLHEETELAHRLRAAGHLVVDVPGAVVHHRVRPDQARRAWLLRRCWHEGRSDAVVDRANGRRERARRALKLIGLAVALVPSQVVPRAGTYVAARALVNAGYLAELHRRGVASGPARAGR